MKDVSMTMNSRLCNKTPFRDCDAKEGKIVCQTVYESGKYIIKLTHCDKIVFFVQKSNSKILQINVNKQLTLVLNVNKQLILVLKM